MKKLWAFAVCLPAALLGGRNAFAENSGPGQLETDRQIGMVEHSTNLVPRGFVKEGHLQFHFTNREQRLMFKAEWDVPRVKANEFSTASAVLEAGKSPSAIPPVSSGWREIRVLDRTQSGHLSNAAVEIIVPRQAGHGIYCRHSSGDAVVFRDARGTVQVRPAAEKPGDVQIDRRYPRQELISAVVAAVEEDLRKTFPEDREFGLSLGRTNRLRLAYVDLAQRHAVLLQAPRVSDDPRRSAKLALKLSTLASFVVLDNLWPLLKNPVSSISRSLHQGFQWSTGIFEARLRKRGSEIPPLSEAPGMDLTAWERWLDHHTHTKRERGSLRLLIDGDQFFPLLERRIAEARQKVNIHVCIFDRDDVAVEVADLLKRRSTNIEVKVVFDRLNSRGAGKAQPNSQMPDGFTEPRSINAYLRSGGQVHLRPQPNPGFSCDHSKVFLIDTNYAYLGGMNIGREYRYEWHDMMAEVQGPVVASFQRQFDKKWAQVGLWGDCGLAAESVCGKRVGPDDSDHPEWIPLRRLYTKTFDRQIRQAELAAINRAGNHVFLENAYLYNNELVAALVRARARGVDVRVIMPAENDFGAGHKSNLVTANYLLEHGVRVCFYPGMSHIKALQVDDWVCFGSANCDSLSLRLNREANVATSDPGFAARFRAELFEPDFKKSRELSETIETSFGDDLADALLNPF